MVRAVVSMVRALVKGVHPLVFVVIAPERVQNSSSRDVRTSPREEVTSPWVVRAVDRDAVTWHHEPHVEAWMLRAAGAMQESSHRDARAALAEALASSSMVVASQCDVLMEGGNGLAAHREEFAAHSIILFCGPCALRSRAGRGRCVRPQARRLVTASKRSTSSALLNSAIEARTCPSRTVTSTFAWSSAARIPAVGFVV